MAAGSGGLWDNLQRRIIVISTMERSVRIAFMSGAMAIILAIIVNVFHALLGPEVTIVLGTVPLGALLIFAIGEFGAFFALALALVLLTGRSRLIAQAVIVVVFTIFSAINAFDILCFAFLLPIGMVCAFGYLRER